MKTLQYLIASIAILSFACSSSDQEAEGMGDNNSEPAGSGGADVAPGSGGTEQGNTGECEEVGTLCPYDGEVRCCHGVACSEETTTGCAFEGGFWEYCVVDAHVWYCDPSLGVCGSSPGDCIEYPGVETESVCTAPANPTSTVEGLMHRGPGLWCVDTCCEESMSTCTDYLSSASTCEACSALPELPTAIQLPNAGTSAKSETWFIGGDHSFGFETVDEAGVFGGGRAHVSAQHLSRLEKGWVDVSLDLNVSCESGDVSIESCNQGTPTSTGCFGAGSLEVVYDCPGASESADISVSLSSSWGACDETLITVGFDNE